MIRERMGKAEQSKHFTLDTNLYRRFCDVACEPILVFQVPEGRLVHCNEAACDVFGASSDQLLDRTDDDLFADFRLKDVINGTGKAAERRYTGMVNIKRDDGVVVSARSRGEVMELEKDRLFFMSLHPVAREEYSEGRLQTVLEEMSIILENIRDSVCLTDTGGNIVFANPAFSNMVHRSLADVLGATVFSLFPESLRESIEQPFQRLVSDPNEQPVEISLESGTENIFLEIRIESIHTETGNHYLLFVFHDFSLLRKEAQHGAVSEERFQYIFRGAPHGLVLFNEEGRLIDINKRALEMLNVSDARTVISTELFETSDPEVLGLRKADADTVVRKVFEGKAKEFPIPAKFKGKKSLALRYQPILHKSGKRSIVLSMSEREPEKDGKVDRVADVSHVVSSVPDVVYRLDVKRNAFEFISSSVLEQTGFTVEEFSLDPAAILKDQVPEEDFRFLSHTIQQHLAKGPGCGPLEVEYRFRRKDGEIIWISDVKSFEFDSEGEVSYVNGIIRDVSRYKKVELQLRDSEEHFRMMFESSPDGLAIFDLPITRFMCNHQFSQMFGYEQHELQDSPWQKLMRVPDNAVHGRMDRLEREGNIDFNAILFTKLGKVLYCNVRCSRFHTSHGPRYCAVVRDMTDRRTLEFQLQQYSQKLEKLVEERTQELTYYSEKLEQLVSERTAKLEAMNKELEQFAYTISHDLRAPLIAIEGFTELLKDELTDALTDESAEWMNIIVNSVQRMNHLISDVLELARIGRVVGEKVDVDLNQVIESIKQEFQIRMEERHVTINVPEPLPVIKTDLQRMRQVFQNLISNAIKYNNKENIEVVITAAKRDDDMVEIVVRDNGIGIPEASQKEIFLLFRRLQTADEEDSTGAGLAIVKKIINSLGGEIWVESTVGEGSAFHFTLPLKAEEA